MLWGYLVVGGSWPVSIYAVTIAGVAAGNIHLDPGGDLQAVDGPAGSGPTGSSAWLGSFEGIILPVLAVFWLVFVASQVLSRRPGGGRPCIYRHRGAARVGRGGDLEVPAV